MEVNFLMEEEKMGNDLKMKINHEIKNARKLMNDPILLVTIIFSLIVVSFFVLVPLWSIFVESIFQIALRDCQQEISDYHFRRG